MKTKYSIIVNTFCLLIIVLTISFGIFAKNKYSNSLTNNHLTKYKTSTIVDSQHSKLAVLTKSEAGINTETNYCDQEENKKIEDWMLNPEFWKIKNPVSIQKDSSDGPAELEEWMIILFRQNIEKADLFSGFVEEDWMKKQHFYIL